MSSVGQAVGAVAGAVIGFYVGGPKGALYGFQIGAAIGGAVDQPTVQGPRIGETSDVTSKEGAARVKPYGIYRNIGGNVIQTTEPIIRKKKTKSGGKGGGSEVETEEVYRTYVIRICEGPINGVRRVWESGDLVYDNSSSGSILSSNNSKFLSNHEFYFGSYSQMPDATVQSVFGIDKAPAYRGTAYMVVKDKNLTRSAAAIPPYVFEVEAYEGYIELTKPYVVDDIDSLELSANVNSIRLAEGKFAYSETMDVSTVDAEQILMEIVARYSTYTTDEDVYDISVVDAEQILMEIVARYSTYSTDEDVFDVSTVDAEQIFLEVVAGYIEYTTDEDVYDVGVVEAEQILLEVV